MAELFSEYPTYEHVNFNPNREKIGQKELDDAKEALGLFSKAYADLLLYTDYKKQHKPQGRHAKDIGQITGKMWLRCLEAMPANKQEAMIARTRQIMGVEEAKTGFKDPSFLAGAMGEFATGILMNNAGLNIEYPEGIEDKRQSADLITILPNGARAHIQAKTISLPENFRRTQVQEKHLPIFSSLETPEDVETLCGQLREIATGKENVNDRLDEVIAYAKIMHEQGRDQGFIPIFSLLMKPGNPGSEASDIDMMTSRPTEIVETEALAELDSIKQRYQ